MSIISETTNATLAYTSSVASTSVPTEGSESFADVLSATNKIEKPSIKELMDITGVSFSDASEMLYGVVGSNTDTRDWNAIMSSKDPVASAKEATAKMYSVDTSSTNTKAVKSDLNATQVFQSDNFAITTANDTKESTVFISDTSGNLLRSISGTSEQVNKTLDYFGLQPSKLSSALSSASAKDVILPSWTETYSSTTTAEPITTKTSTQSTANTVSSIDAPLTLSSDFFTNQNSKLIADTLIAYNTLQKLLQTIK